jgi:hypothetical protein
MDNRNMMKNMMKDHEDDMMRHCELGRMKKQEEFDKDMRFLNAVEYQKMLDRQKQLEGKMKLKSDFDNDMERSKHNKHVHYNANLATRDAKTS